MFFFVLYNPKKQSYPSQEIGRKIIVMLRTLQILQLIWLSNIIEPYFGHLVKRWRESLATKMINKTFAKEIMYNQFGGNLFDDEFRHNPS